MAGLSGFGHLGNFESVFAGLFCGVKITVTATCDLLRCHAAVELADT
jgi:hypothetical protein